MTDSVSAKETFQELITHNHAIDCGCAVCRFLQDWLGEIDTQAGDAGQLDMFGERVS